MKNKYMEFLIKKNIKYLRNDCCVIKKINFCLVNKKLVFRMNYFEKDENSTTLKI